MAHVYNRNFTHFIWATWDRAPLLTGHIGQEAYALIQNQCRCLGVTLYALGGVPDYVHLLVSLPRTLCLADFIEAVKGISSKALNDTHGSATWAFRWQGGYSSHSVSAAHMPRVTEYIQNQKQHHADKLLWLSCEPALNGRTLIEQAPACAGEESDLSDARAGGELHL